ncbi:putative anti-sigma-YlaC factor YlaD [Pseudosporangium ferrugineum]|uniref:Putative anti-sigma-YlaC factor YlaD n=2 Tax=Pseudosporangium ferrugineum TaxID=439699 RepID=A0A2T0S7C1_9ACTN|nr:putative anti-sigma-YlaC factor YlaD [Pseudosporangium ferrugineum]
MLSAQLDGEDDPADRGRVDEHLAGCAGCREWFERAAAVNRLTRTGLVTDVPDLTDSILAALAVPGAPPATGEAGSLSSRSGRALWGGRLREWFAVSRPEAGADAGVKVPWRARVTATLYVALAAVGAVQLILGLDQVGGAASSLHVHSGVDATPGHLWHESAAWNVAVGAGFLFIALRRNRPAGLVPMLTAFVGMLLLLSVNDLSAARVDATRLVSHGFVLLGYLLVVALTRVGGGSAQPPGDRSGLGSRWHLAQEEAAEGENAPRPPKLRLVPRGPLTATHEPTTPDRRAA